MTNAMLTAATALAVAGVTAVGGIITAIIGWRSRRRQDARDDFTVIRTEMKEALALERTQRRLLTSYVLDLLRWGRRVDPDPSNPIPEPPVDLDLSPWH